MAAGGGPMTSSRCDRPAAPFGPRQQPLATKTESLASEWSDYSGPDPAAESVYKVPPPPRPLPGGLAGSAPPSPAPPQAGGTGVRPANYLDMSGSHSGTPSPSQVPPAHILPFFGAFFICIFSVLKKFQSIHLHLKIPFLNYRKFTFYFYCTLYNVQLVYITSLPYFPLR